MGRLAVLDLSLRQTCSILVIRHRRLALASGNQLMAKSRRHKTMAGFTGVWVLVMGGPLALGMEPATEAPQPVSSTPWATPTRQEIREQLVEIMKTSAGDAALGERLALEAEPMLAELETTGDPLEVVVNMLSVTSPRIAKFVSACRQSPPELVSTEWMTSQDVSEFARSNLLLYGGRALVRHGYFDEAIVLLDKVKLDQTVDPASYLFFRATAEHQLVKIDDVRSTLHRLLSHGQPLPVRFENLARLMQADVAEVKPDTLGHIARRMSDAQRRLDLGKADDDSQQVQREIVEALDRLIDKIEEQQRQQQQQQQQAQGDPSANPMEETQPGGDLKGEGKVDIRDIGNQAGWGDLPPKERERVMQEIGRDFPAHYRDLIEEYLRRLATDERSDETP